MPQPHSPSRSRRPVIRHLGATLSAITLCAGAAAPAHACSLVPPWQYRTAERIEFLGTPIHDTVFAGPGSNTFTEAPGHFGRGTARAVYGQRVRVDRLGAAARRALPASVREVLLVPWDYGADCARVPWGRSAGFLPDTITGVFAATLRPREHWAGDLPTLDLTPFMQPYRDPSPDTTVRDGLPRPRLTAAQLLDLYDRLPVQGPPLDSFAALAHAAWLRDDPVFAGRYPTTEFLREALGAVTSARMRALRVPVTGTWRLDVALDGAPPRTLFVRTEAQPHPAYAGARPAGDTALAPREPAYYSLPARAAKRMDMLPSRCEARQDDASAYIYMRWHASTAGVTTWDGEFDARLFPPVLDSAERADWQARVTAANAARRDSMRRLAESGVRPAMPPPYVQPFRMQFTRDADARLRVSGTMELAHIGTAQVRGERIDEQPMGCGPLSPVDTAAVLRAVWDARWNGLDQSRAVLWTPAAESGTSIGYAPSLRDSLVRTGLPAVALRPAGDDTVVVAIRELSSSGYTIVIALSTDWSTRSVASGQPCRTRSGNQEVFVVSMSAGRLHAVRRGAVLHGDTPCLPITRGDRAREAAVAPA
jgi:hypothetical protein